MARTGTGTTLTGSITTFSMKIIGMDPFQMALDDIDASNMDSEDYKQYIPADLIELGAMSIEVEYDGSVHIEDSMGVVQTWTIDVGGRGTGHKIVGTGYINSMGAQVPLNDKMTGTVGIKWDGTSFDMAAA